MKKYPGLYKKVASIQHHGGNMAKFSLRLKDELYDIIREHSDKYGISINKVIVEVLIEKFNYCANEKERILESLIKDIIKEMVEKKTSV